jgi:hypothetical protein
MGQIGPFPHGLESVTINGIIINKFNRSDIEALQQRCHRKSGVNVTTKERRTLLLQAS